jgi:septum formation protein
VLILASASPRRKTLLRQMKIRFHAVPSGIPEPSPRGIAPAAYAKKLALAKALHVAGFMTHGIVLGADTIVVLKNKIYGKPKHVKDAVRMLGQLQGTTHKVITGVAVVDAKTGRKKVAHAVSKVTMKPLSPAEVKRYASKHPDKAGSYAVQEKNDSVVKKIVGSYSNVVGLPMELVKKMLKGFPTSY